MSALNRVRLWWGLTRATLRERFAPLPVDDEARIVGWVPDAPDALLGALTSSNAINHTVMDSAQGHPSGSDSEPSTAVLERADSAQGHYANRVSKPLLVRTDAVTELVALGDVDLATPIYDALVADLAQLDAAKRRAMRTPTAEFWAIVDASRGYFCTHCADDGDHTLCPGCECGCLLVGAAS